MRDLLGVLTRDASTGTVRLSHDYATDPGDLWEALTDPVRLGRWFGPVTGDLREGGRYHVVFDPADEGQQAWGEVLGCDRPIGYAVTWEFPGEPASRVDIAIAPAGGGSRLTLVHSGLGHGSDVGYAAGWEVYLRQLEDALGGVHEPDRWGEWQELRDRYAARLGA